MSLQKTSSAVLRPIWGTLLGIILGLAVTALAICWAPGHAHADPPFEFHSGNCFFASPANGGSGPVICRGMSSADFPVPFIFPGTVTFADGSTWSSSALAIKSPAQQLLTTDTSWSPFTNAAFIAAEHGNNNGIVGFELNDLAPSTNALPAGLVGYGKVKSGATGNTAYGSYVLGELAASAGVAVGVEFTCRNNSGNAPDTSLPPNEAIGTTTAVCNGLQVTSGGGNNSSIGISVAEEAGSTSVFNTGEYISKSGYAQYGLFIDAPTSGTYDDAVLQSNGNGIPLQIGITATMQAANTAIGVLDNGSVTRFSVRQNGDIYGNTLNVAAINLNSHAFPTSGTAGDVATMQTNGVYQDSGTLLSALLTSATAATTYAPLTSAALIGTPTAPTAATGNNSTQLATTGFVANTAGIVLLGSAKNVNLNPSSCTPACDTSITIATPTTNWIANAVQVVGVSGSFSTVKAGVYTAASQGGTALVAQGALAGITSTTINTAANAIQMTLAGQNEFNVTTVYFNVGTAQGGTSTANIYVWGRPAP